MKYAFIINPKSGKRIHSKINHVLETKFNSENIQIFKTESFPDIEKFVKIALENNAECVVAIGGDGTISEVARHLNNSKTALAIIPAGSGNGYARNIGISLKIDQAIEQLYDSKKIQVDMGSVNGNSFIGVAGVGYDAHVASSFNLHGKRGSWPYFKIALKEFFKYRNSSYRIKTDSETIETEAFIIAIAKSSQFGNGAVIAPQAKLEDGFFDLVILKPMSFIRTILLARRMFNGTIDQSKYVIYKKVKSVQIVRDGQFKYHLDGELFDASGSMNIELFKSSLYVMIPNSRAK